MMPPPRQSKTCVENIKKKFENVNFAEAANAPFSKGNLSSKPLPSRGTGEEECNSSISKSDSPRKRKPTGVISSNVLESSYSASPPVKIVPLKIDRQLSSPTSRNIRRSPAFRCDKVVRARNIISHSTCRDSPKSVVVRRVKQFDDQSGDLLDSSLSAVHSEIPNVKPAVDWRSKLKSDSNEAPSKKPSKSSGSSEDLSTPSSEKDSLATQKLSSSLNLSADRKVEAGICSAISSRESDICNNTAFRKSSTSTFEETRHKDQEFNKVEKPVRILCNSKEKESKTNVFVKTGKQCRKADQVVSAKVKADDLSAAVKAALKSPLPSGPPPKKPPRTFAHVPVKKPNGSTSAIPSHQPPIPVDTLPLSVITKPIRSKTESQILLRKLENAIGGMLNQNPPYDKTLCPNFVKSDKEEHSSKKDISPDLVSMHSQKLSNKNLPGHAPAFKLGNCFNAFYCAGDSTIYSKIVSPDLQSDENKDLMTTEEVRQKFYGTLHKAHSEEHIYAEPFEHINRVDGGSDHRKSSFSSDNGISSVKRPDILHSISVPSKLKPSLQGDSKTGGLHYLCSPIHESVPGLAVDMQTRSLPVPFEAINRELVGTVGPTSLPVDTSKMGQAPNQTSVPMPRGIDSGESDSALNPTKIKLLMNQAFGAPLQRLPAAAAAAATAAGVVGVVGVDSSDSDSVASTPDEGGQAPSLALPTKPSRSSACSAPNTNNVKEIRRPSVPPPDIPDVSKEALQQLTAERRAYIRRVSSHAMSTRSRRISSGGSAESRLFECLLLVGVNLDPDRPKCKVPYIKSTYPPDADVPPHIADFCFPDASEWPPPVVEVEEGAAPGEEQCYCLVLTKDTGERKYGYCRRVQPEGANLCLPLAYCMLTPHRASGFYYKVLGELESRHGQPEALQIAFIKELYACGFPSPTQNIRIHCGDGSVSSGCGGGSPSAPYIHIQRQYDPKLEQRDVIRLFAALTVPVILQVFGSLLMERKVLFVSSSISKLSACVEALESLLFPFSWIHTCISVLPTSMLELCCAPLPYIMGVLRGKKPRTIPQIEDGIVVDLDSSTVVQCMQDEMTILPVSTTRGLKDTLQVIRNCTTPNDRSRNILVSEAFVRLFVELCGHYQSHIVVQQDGKKVFEKESFIKAVPSRYTQSFLECFTDTAMFSVFIDTRLDKRDDTKGMFEQRIVEYCEERDKNTFLYPKNYKGLNKKKTLGDRFKDWTLF